MGVHLVLEESNFTGYIPDDTEYLATVADISLRERTFRDNETAKRLTFKFKLISDDAHNGEELYGETSTNFTDHPNCRLYRWAETLLGMRLPPHYQLDTDDLLDKRCRVIVQYGTYEKQGQTQEFNRVKDIKPTRQAAESMAAASASTDFDDF